MGKLLMCIFGGWFGLHKFAEKKVGMGVLYLFTGGLFCIGWFVDCIKYFTGYVNGRSVTKEQTAAAAAQPVEPESPYIFLSFKVAGVTFKNGRKTRQAILRAFKWGDEDIETIDLEPYIFEGNDAVYVKFNDQIIGNIPSECVQTFLDYEEKYKRDNIACDIYGGNKLDDGSRTNYGCELYIRYLK